MICDDGSLKPEIKRRIRLARMKMAMLSKSIFDNWMKHKLIRFKQEVLEVILYACATWTTTKDDINQLTAAHRSFLHRITGFRKSKFDEAGKRLISYKDLLVLTGCESIETLIKRRRLIYAGLVIRMKDHSLHKILLLGEVKSQ